MFVGMWNLFGRYTQRDGIWYHFKPTYIILIPDLKLFCCIYLMNILIPFNFRVQIVIMFTNDYVFETFLRQEIVDYLSNGDFNCNFIQLFQWLVDLPLWLGHIFKPWNGFWRLTVTILKFFLINLLQANSDQIFPI